MKIKLKYIVKFFKKYIVNFFSNKKNIVKFFSKHIVYKKWFASIVREKATNLQKE